MTTAVASSFNPSSPMVSQPYTPDRALAVRRPPSVSSRSTGTRRHRSGRSHHGGSSYLPQNEFPHFAHTGDVEIIVSIDGQEKKYLLHRLILSQCSGFFEASTSEQWSQQPEIQSPTVDPSNERRLSIIGEESEGSQVARLRSNSSSSSQMTQKPFWRYELDTGNENEDDVPMLVRKAGARPSMFGGEPSPRPPAPRTKPPAPSNGFFRSISAMQSAIHIPQTVVQDNAENDILRDYDNLFRTFYNYPPNLDAVNITEAYIQCKTLLTLADMYDALEVVGPRIDHHLLQFQSRLWKQIAKYPPSYLKLGYLSRSKVIFTEALIHVVGQWPQGAPQLRNVPDSILDLIEDKAADLDDLKCRTECRLFRLTLTTSRGERVTPLNAPLDFQAVSLFRHWLAENITPPPPPIPKTANPNDPSAPASPLPPVTTGRTFRLIGAGGPAYLGHDEIKKFIKQLKPDEYSRDGLRRFEKKVEEMKRLAKETVKPLMKNFLELEGAGLGQGLGYMTCTKVEEDEFPW